MGQDDVSSRASFIIGHERLNQNFCILYACSDQCHHVSMFRRFPFKGVRGGLEKMITEYGGKLRFRQKLSRGGPLNK